MSSGVKKTNAMRMLDSAKIPYEVRTYCLLYTSDAADE